MDAGNGTYLISARASAIRGGTTGANSVAYQDAQAFCHKAGKRAVVINANERDVYHGSVGGSWNSSGGSIGGGVFASGNVNLRFRCA